MRPAGRSAGCARRPGGVRRSGHGAGRDVGEAMGGGIRGEVRLLVHAVPVPQRPPQRLQRRHQVKLK